MNVHRLETDEGKCMARAYGEMWVAFKNDKNLHLLIVRGQEAEHSRWTMAVSEPSPTAYRLCDLSKLLNLSVSRFPLMWSGSNTSAKFFKLLGLKWAVRWRVSRKCYGTAHWIKNTDMKTLLAMLVSEKRVQNMRMTPFLKNVHEYTTEQDLSSLFYTA